MNRHNFHHRPKKQLVGHQVQPAWRPNVAQAANRAADQAGSKIFISRLPVDVTEQEVEELFKKTVGPVKESFLVYNSQGKSKGMAVVAFNRPGDAALARTKYDGKIVDGRRPIKIEIVTDGVTGAASPAVPQPTPSLMDRLGVQPQTKPIPTGPSLVQRTQVPTRIPAQPRQFRQPRHVVQPVSVAPAIPVARPRTRVKKGPKRLNKKQVTIEDLDQEMDNYRASFPDDEFSMS
ncbi:hypothetical protein FA15DRAFT_50592 [Coprinopsis marcescibilis]|uniref:RRM domain-containing protein n=1 Tax=Coprinopsis marcescibilis TaxID=230819 RepID=A0A5C3L1Q0_COPMA|nr:hypothetical protein FA15DRAFT_50592 [Coprinopsis marcescibilis]